MARKSPGATADISVRRLGVDYCLGTKWTRASSKLKVHKSRMLKAKHRVARVKRMIPGGSARLFT